MKRYTRFFTFLMLISLFTSARIMAQNEYTQRFLTMYDKIYDPNNGYFSADGVPYHSIETLMCEAPDHGHETTSEAYSYWIWLDAMYGGVTGNWTALKNSWDKMEKYAIPTDKMQPTAADYTKATFAGEYPEPSDYPSPLETNVPVGEDPMSPDLTATYGANIYGMHWLFDCDNVYGYGNFGDGKSTPSYINTFQRGEQESVWETVTHPSWEDFSWGSNDGTGFLKLFIKEDGGTPTKQWRYTNAPDADARVVQAMYWALQFAKEQNVDPSSLPLTKASKMGDFLRLSMCDKYFRPLGVQDKTSPGGTGYESVHYLLSWYYAWGGPLVSNNWAWRIGCSISHFGYQNPVAAYALSQVSELKPVSANGVRDWGTSLERQLEFYTWLQSAEGAIAGGATNSYNGQYEAYPESLSTFYEMAYVENPVYHDPGSNTWFGMQAWSMERIAELYYISENPAAKKLLDKWIPWAMSEVKLANDGTFKIPSKIGWSGQPNTWNASNPVENKNLHVTVEKYAVDLGIAACLAKTFTYYAAATAKYATLDTDARDMAKELLDRMWNKYYEETGAGVAVEEEREDYTRFFEQEVYIPSGWAGKMANGDEIKPGIKFKDIRTFYENDSEYANLLDAYTKGEVYKTKYHRFWAQADIALANAEYGRFFGDNSVTSVTVSPSELALEIGDTKTLTATVLPAYASNTNVTWTTSNSSVASVSNSGVVTAVASGTAYVIATTVEGGYSDTCTVSVSDVLYDLAVTIVGDGTVTLSPTGGSYAPGTIVTLTATPAADNNFDGWTGDIEGTEAVVSITMNSDKSVTATFSTPSPCGSYTVASLPISVSGVGEYCWKTSSDISYVNSWNMDKVEINGVDFTNTWSSNMPAKKDGFYYIHCVGPYSWSHFEAAGSSRSAYNTTSLKTQNASAKNVASIYPNPFNESISIKLNNVDNVERIVVMDQVGRIISAIGKSDISSVMTVGSDLPKGIYIISVQSKAGTETYKALKE